MSVSWVGWAIVLLVGLASAFIGRRIPKPFRVRPCTGREWRRRFPTAGKDSIRRFLALFLESFDLPAKQGLKFSPDDKLMDIYGALYPLRGVPDSLEVETFVDEIRREYDVDLESGDNREITLGHIFARTLRS